MAQLQQMAMSNPEINQALQLINQNGGNAKSLFYGMAQQQGVDPNTIIAQVNSLMNQNGSAYR